MTNDFELDPNDLPMPEPKVGEEEEAEEPIKKKKKKKDKKPKSVNAAAAPATVPPPAKKAGIKTLPLVMLIMLMGTTLIPALLYAGDWFGNFVQKQHFLGSMAHKLNIGSSPKKRVFSFYEKHSPEKLDEIDGILAKYYGDYLNASTMTTGTF